MSTLTCQYIADHSVALSKDFQWEYTDRRRVQEIVPGVFIGPMSAVRDKLTLERLSITTIIAVRTALTFNMFKPKFPESFRYETFDLVEGSLISLLPRIKPFIDAALARKEHILFYDETGNAKAPLLVCSYLMDALGLSAEAALQTVKSKRLSVAFNDHERYQLQEYETILSARSNVVAHSYSEAELQRGNRRRKYSDSSMTSSSEFDSGRRKTTII